MHNTSLNKFRHIYVNIFISLMLIILCTLTVVGSSVGVFSANDLQAIYHGNSSEKNVSLMINVYWGTEYLDRILEILEKKNVKTTFFVGGYWVAKESDMLKKINASGHEIANHGYYHKDQDTLSYEQNVNEIMFCHNLVNEVLGVEMNLFAPPSGAFSQSTLRAAQDNGYQTIMWSNDTIDWRDKDSALICSRATQNINNGAFVLMHPTECTLNALENIIDGLISQGFNLTTVSQNLGLE